MEVGQHPNLFCMIFFSLNKICEKKILGILSGGGWQNQMTSVVYSKMAS